MFKQKLTLPLYQHYPNLFLINNSKISDNLQNGFFRTSKQPFAIHFFRAFCNVRLVAIPEIFAQTQRSDRSLATHSLFSTFLNHLLLWNKVLLNLWDVAYFVLQVRQIFCNTSFWHHYTTPSSFQCYKDCALSGAICSLKLPIFFIVIYILNRLEYLSTRVPFI